ncbi:hypothetical protein B0H12DRAFT_1234207 [Mycena haematopus]|nr:hypothetical protein B0H12DRAFT_1234207 [Mycena haematopus]
MRTNRTFASSNPPPHSNSHPYSRPVSCASEPSLGTRALLAHSRSHSRPVTPSSTAAQHPPYSAPLLLLPNEFQYCCPAPAVLRTPTAAPERGCARTYPAVVAAAHR